MQYQKAASVSRHDVAVSREIANIVQAAPSASSQRYRPIYYAVQHKLMENGHITSLRLQGQMRELSRDAPPPVEMKQHDSPAPTGLKNLICLDNAELLGLSTR